jgi:phosphoglycolate phosphatase-like HAD superfamily hydrolase
MAGKSTKPTKPGAGQPDWYASAEGRRQTQREFERALRAGTLIHSSGVRLPRTSPRLLAELLEQAKAKATRPVSIRLSVADLEMAKKIGHDKGIGYQTVLKEAIHHGLKRAS